MCSEGQANRRLYRSLLRACICCRRMNRYLALSFENARSQSFTARSIRSAHSDVHESRKVEAFEGDWQCRKRVTNGVAQRRNVSREYLGCGNGSMARESGNFATRSGKRSIAGQARMELVRWDQWPPPNQ
jgi:hypothetical protein